MISERDLHPIVRQLNPSQEQISPIRSRGKDIVVTAGAGTGKTRTLVARFLHLLAGGEPLRSIVAITFTKKAAREMRNRVREEVKDYLLSGDLDDNESALWRSVYEELDAARISTIHSLAGDILRQHPAEMGLDPAFKMLDESETARMKGLAVDAALVWAGGDEMASGLFPLFGEWKLRRILSSLLNRRLEVSDGFANPAYDLWSDWEPLLLAPLKAFVEDPAVRSGLDALQALKYDGTFQRAENAGDLLVEDLRIVIEAWEAVKESQENGDWIRISRLVGRLGDHLKQKGKNENWAPATPRSTIKEIQDIFNQRIGSTALDLGVDKRLAEEIIPALGALWNYAEGWYKEARNQVNGLDFDDLEEKILQLLTQFPAVLDHWQKEIRALLVDEYQDTNARQRELVNMLTGGGNDLFIVGDGKQSIYRFRGADVAVFREEQERIGREGEIHHLDTSYRSHPQLLGQLNGLLAPVLGDRDDLAYVEPFSELKPGRTDPPRIVLPAYVEFHLAAGTKAGGAGGLAADAVAGRLLEIFRQGTDQDPERGLNFGDVAVLCRASSSFSDFEAAFERAGIPYTTVAGHGFYERPEVRDVLNALRVFADPQNDLAMAGLLRSPVVGFSDEFLFDLRNFQQTENIDSLFSAAQFYAPKLNGEIKKKLASLVTMIEDLEALAGRVTTADLIGRYLDRTAYAAVLTLAGQERAAANLRKLVADAQASGYVNLADYLNSIEEMRNVAIREGEAQFVAEGSVQIMTVHQAKGLEFPIVVLGDSAKRERLSRDIIIDECFGLLLPYTAQRVEEDARGIPVIQTGKSLAYEMVLEAERMKEEAEENRLLYVAATRAQELLIVSGAIGNPTRDGKLPGFTGWLGKLTIELDLDDSDLQVTPDGNECHQIQIEKAGYPIVMAVYESSMDFTFRAISAPDLEGAEVETIDSSSWNKVGQEIPQASSVEFWREPIFPASSTGSSLRAPASMVGRVVHSALERWKFPEDGESDFIKWVEAGFRSAGIYSPDAIKSGYRRVRQILDRFTATELYQTMCRAEIALHEVPFSRLDEDGKVVTGSIDALFKEADRWILVEFKTDQIKPGEDIDWDSVDYIQQVSGYLDAAGDLIEGHIDPVLCFLDHGGRVKLVTDRW